MSTMRRWLIASLLSASLVRAQSPIITLDDLPLLFADDSGVAASSGVIRTVHPARTRSKTANPYNPTPRAIRLVGVATSTHPQIGPCESC